VSVTRPRSTPSHSVEPERRIELLTYALRVRCGCKLVESGGDTSLTTMGFTHFLGTRWIYTEASGLATEVTTLSDIHRSSGSTRLLSLLMVTQPQNGLVIYTAPVPHFFGSFSISCATAVPEWSIILSDTWTNIPASLSGLPLQYSARWTCWRASVMGLVDKRYARPLSSTSLPSSGPLKRRIHHEVGEYLESGFVMPC
jgi:hypothetical protein